MIFIQVQQSMVGVNKGADPGPSSLDNIIVRYSYVRYANMKIPIHSTCGWTHQQWIDMTIRGESVLCQLTLGQVNFSSIESLLKVLIFPK